MEISLRSLLMAGLGTVAYTYEAGMSIIDDLVKKGEITLAQGKELNEELKRKLSGTESKPGTQGAITAENLREILAGMNLATKQDITELRERLNRLENK